MPQTVIDLGQKIKAKYPGQYDDLTDEQVGRQVKVKFPGAYDDFADVTAPQSRGATGSWAGPGPGVAAPGGATGTLMGIDPFGQANAAAAIVKGIGSTGFGIKQIADRVLGRAPQPKPAILQPSNPHQETVMKAEQAAEFMVPGMFTAKLGKMGTLARAGTEAVSAGAVAGLQTGGDPVAVRNAAVIAGIIPIAAKPVSWIGTKMGTKIQDSVLRATDADLERGFDIKNVFKHDVGGSAHAVADKSAVKIAELAKSLRAELNRTPQTSQIDVLTLLDDVEKELNRNAAQQFGRDSAIRGALDKLTESLSRISPSGKVNIIEAQEMKRSIGLMGSWTYGQQDEKSKALELVATKLYPRLREAIEKTAVNGAAVKAINKQLGELIPIEQVAIKRIPVADRQNLLSLTDIVTLVGGTISPANLWIFMLNQASKRGAVGAGLVKAGSQTTGRTVAPIAAGAVTANRPRQ